MRRILSFLNIIFTTVILSIIAIGVSLFDPQGIRVHRIARFWASISLKIAGISVSVEGKENISEPPYLFMANHQSALDIYVLLATMPIPFKFIAKQELFKVPFLGWAIKRARYISIDRANPREALKAIEGAGQKIRDGMTVLIFPEGTRSKDGHLLPFLKGGFFLASRAQVPVVPIAIVGTSALNPTGSILIPPKRKGHVNVRIGKSVVTEGKGTAVKTALMEDIRGEIERLLLLPSVS
jgi:1-acyl-sn-glycerol-3-phosphate acyltransferase